MVEFVYIDETGSDLGPGSRHPELLLVAVVAHESRVQAIRNHLVTVAEQALGAVSEHFELHGYDLWSGKGPWKVHSPELRMATYERALSALLDLDLWVAHSTIHKDRLNERHRGAADSNAYRLALQFLLEKVDRVPGELRIVVADESKEQSEGAIDMFADLQALGLGEVPGRRLESFIDSLHFVRSHDNPGVQLADLTAFVLQRFRGGRDTHPAAQAGLRRLNELVLSRSKTWRDPWPPSAD